MGATVLPAVYGQWKEPPVADTVKSLMTPIGIVEGEVLTYLEEHGATTLRHLTREMGWPTTMIMMAVGALVRAGLARATQHELEVIVDLWHVRPGVRAEASDPVPGIWGG